MVTHVLSRGGYSVTESDSGPAAIDHLKSAATDIIVTDWNMPGMTGVELCRRVLSKVAAPPAIIMLTSHESPVDRDIAITAGADRFVSKPFEANALLAEVAAAVNDRSK